MLLDTYLTNEQTASSLASTAERPRTTMRHAMISNQLPLTGYFIGAWSGTGWLSDTRLVSLRIESPNPLDMSPKEAVAGPGWQTDAAVHTDCGAICAAAIWASGTAAQPDKASARAQAVTGKAMEKY